MKGATMTRQSRIVHEGTVARNDAEALLQSLLRAKDESERRMRELKQSDAMKQVTGRSSLDNAIDSTRRMIDTLSRNIDEAKRTLSDEDLAVLDELSGSN